MDVAGLGSLAMDVFMRVDSLPKADTFCVIEETNYFPGGSGTNVIVQLARLGAACAYIGKVGDDHIGTDVLASLNAEGVNTQGMVVQKGGVTLHTNVVVDRKGDKFIMLDMGNTFAALSKDEINHDLIQKAKVYYTDLFPSDAAITGLMASHNGGLKTVFNMQAQLATYEGMGLSKDVILDTLKYVDVFAPCRDGLYGLAGTEDLDKCEAFIRNYFQGVFIVTLGSKGSVAWDSGRHRFEVPPRKITPVDTTGAGDSYMGSFIYKYCLQGASLRDAMQFATACAAYTCTGLGARFSPNLEQAETFIEQVQ
jgi:sugar/nucleoside kinase (ribokinase family)